MTAKQQHLENNQKISLAATITVQVGRKYERILLLPNKHY